MKRPSLNFITGGPSAGKTSLVGQLTRSHFQDEPFFIPGLDLPEGDVVWIQTDRAESAYRDILSTLGILNDTHLHTLNIADNDLLHQLTRPAKKIEEYLRLEALRDYLARLIAPWNAGTVVLDLYEEFQTAHLGDSHRMAFESRSNLRWAIRMNVCIIGLPYVFKQTTLKKAARAQDRQAGSLLGQASANYKVAIVDPEETGKACSYIHVKPGPGEGLPSVHKVQRNTHGFFEPYDGPDDAEEARNENQDRSMFLDVLPEAFRAEEAVEIAQARHICSRATTYRWLGQLVEQGCLKRPSRDNPLWVKT